MSDPAPIPPEAVILIDDLALSLSAVMRHVEENHGTHHWLHGHAKGLRDRARKLIKKPLQEERTPTKIGDIRQAIRGLRGLVDVLTGGTREEFIRQSVGPQLMVRIMEIEEIVIPDRYVADKHEQGHAIAYAKQTIQRWQTRRTEYLDALTKEHTGCDSFAELIQQKDAGPVKLNCNEAGQRFLADRADEAWAAMCSPRRISRTPTPLATYTVERVNKTTGVVTTLRGVSAEGLEAIKSTLDPE